MSLILPTQRRWRQWPRGAGRTVTASSAEDGAFAPMAAAKARLSLPAAEHPQLSLDRLAHEFSLKDELDGAWAVRPLELVRERGLTMLVLEIPAATRSTGFGPPMDIGRFLQLPRHRRGHGPGQCPRARSRPQGHQAGQYPGQGRSAQVRLTGFGIASRLPRERQSPEPLSSSKGHSPTWRRSRPVA